MVAYVTSSAEIRASPHAFPAVLASPSIMITERNPSFPAAPDRHVLAVDKAPFRIVSLY
ncbi:hypothetical protein [Paraburkholderia xenovorans]|uniref:hypothetical protein n=1 Tax=Paraburkholderia xenovorans TaxID=36873 RepID=UPI0003240737|nr:hypothetical protein [Paraburkholderia xenovorans]